MTTPQVPAAYTSGLGEIIRAYRLYLGMTQQELADRLDKDRRDYQRIERGKDHCPPGLVSTLADLVGEFHRDVDQVLDRIEDNAVDGRINVHVSSGDDPVSIWQRLVAGHAAVLMTTEDTCAIEVSLTLVGEHAERSAS